MSQNLPAPEPPAPDLRQSPWAPLRLPTFRMLWLVTLSANTTLWMSDVAAAWVMTTMTTSPTLIALVQTASALPVFLMGLPSGALADIVDRRRFFIATQFWLAASGALLFLASSSGVLNPTLLLVLVFLNGIGLAMRWPVYAAVVPEVVPRAELPVALALNAVAMNLSRVIGPLLAGAIIASIGTSWVFALNFAISIAAGLVLLRWERETKPSVLPGERFFGAMRMGIQYVRESTRVKDATVRTAAFFFHSTAIVALLPLEARRLGSEGATIYTVLLAAMGVGAILAATQLPRARARYDRDWLASRGCFVQAIAAAAVALAPNVWLAVPAMLIAGAAWIVVANSVTVAAQLALPDWIRARGMSIYQMAIMGSSALGAVVWGRTAEWTNVTVSVLLASAAMIASIFLTRNRKLEAGSGEDFTPTHAFHEPVPARPIELDEGPVMVTLEYFIDPARSADFMAIMAESRGARLRQGALSWGLFEDVQKPGRFVEYFACETWADYLRRFDRFTQQDERLQQMRFAFHVGEKPPEISRFIAMHPPAR